MKSKKGFTLIELLVVISIISLLSSIVIASLSTARERARIAGAKAFASRAFQALGAEAGIILNFELTTSPFTTEESGDNNQIVIALSEDPVTSTDTPLGRGNSVDFIGSVVKAISVRATRIELSDAIGPGKNFTFATWFKPEGNPTGDGLIFFRRSGNNASLSEGIYYSGGKFCGRVVYASGNANVCNPASLQLNKWYHLAFSINSQNSTATLYVDGQEVARVSFSGQTLRSYATTDHFTVGGILNNLANGVIDEARFYTDAINR